MKTSDYLSLAAILLVLITSAVSGQTEKGSAVEKPAPEPKSIVLEPGRAQLEANSIGPDANFVTNVTVAIMDFESKAPGNPDLGSQIGDILTARLSIYDQFRLVERRKLGELLKEHEMNLSGMVDTSEAVKVGKLVGARIMIFGRAFPVDKDLYLVAKLVGTETSRVKGVIAKGNLESNLSEIMDQLVEKLVAGLEKWTPQLLPKKERLINKIARLKRRLEGKELPTVAVLIPETHISRRVADPAAETEIRRVFQKVGFKVIDVKEKAGESEDPYLKDADIVVTGEGFSEFGTRIGGLVSCLARLEVQATERKSHRIIASERTTRRAVDLSEAIAGKTALQAAGHELAIKLIEELASQMSDIQKVADD
ncbi:MAG: CsgG/HfaB family protein [Planctomycetota bacterium]